MMSYIDINLVIPNQYRNFDIYPIDQEHVDRLAESYDEAKGGRDFGIIAVRPANDAGKYEQVFGHHRLAAMKQVGFDKVRVLIDDVDEDRAIREMLKENTLQRGYNVAAQIDSVAAIIQRLAYVLLVSEDFERLGKILPSLFLTKHSYEQSKKRLLSGNGLGRSVIQAYDNGLTEGEIRTAINALKDTGAIASIITKVQERVAVEVKETKATEVERLRIEKEAKAARLEAESLAKEAARLAKDAAEKATKARKAKAIEAAEAAESHRLALETLRKKAAIEEKEKRDAAKARQDARNKTIDEARETAKLMSEKSRGLHAGVLALLKNDGQLEAFRLMVVTDIGQRIFPKEGQVQLVKDIIAKAESLKVKPTAAFIKEQLQAIQSKKDAALRDMIEAKRNREIAESAEREAEYILRDLSAVSGNLMQVVSRLDTGFAKPEVALWIRNKANMTQLIKHLDNLDAGMKSIREQLGVGTFKDAPRQEKAVN